jgi:hypothetical protein
MALESTITIFESMVGEYFGKTEVHDRLPTNGVCLVNTNSSFAQNNNSNILRYSMFVSRRDKCVIGC